MRAPGRQGHALDTRAEPLWRLPTGGAKGGSGGNGNASDAGGAGGLAAAAGKLRDAHSRTSAHTTGHTRRQQRIR